jgi:hypothetical protein
MFLSDGKITYQMRPVRFVDISLDNTDCFNTYNPSSPLFTDTTPSNAMNRQWVWMTCNEPFGNWEVGAPSGRPSLVSRLVTTDYWIRQCGLFFPLDRMEKHKASRQEKPQSKQTRTLEAGKSLTQADSSSSTASSTRGGKSAFRQKGGPEVRCRALSGCLLRLCLVVFIRVTSAPRMER